MKSGKFALIAGGVFVLGVWWALRPAASPSASEKFEVLNQNVSPPLPSAAPKTSAPPVATPGRLVNKAPLAASSVPTPPPQAVEEPDPEEVIAQNKISRMLRDFRTRMGENPVGTNAEIMHAMGGDNPKQLHLAPPEGISVNDQGELVDRWGTPYFFHQLSKDLMEIRSAGPDRRMWTGDDIVTK